MTRPQDPRPTALSEGQGATQAPRPPGEGSGVLQVTSQQLFAGAAEVQIDHGGVRYRLKQTSLGKLILTK